MPDPRESSDWNGDVNEAVVEEWKSRTTPFERVREVLATTNEPQYAKEFAERARVSEPTARKHLETLTKTGFASVVKTGRGKQYLRSGQAVAISRISDLHSELTREELAAGIREMRAEIRSYQDEYDATDPNDLALRLETGDEGWVALGEWRTTERNLKVAQAALALYDFDPNRSGDRSTESDDSDDRGAFARDGRGLSA